MIFAVPLAAAAALLVFGLMAGRKKEETPALTIGDASTPPAAPAATDGPPGGADVHPETPVSAPVGALPADTKPPTGDVAVAHTDDTFDAALAEAIKDHNVEALKELAAQAEKMGLLTVAKSIRDEIARLTSAPPAATPPGPDKPVLPPGSGLATYIVKAGDTGTSIAKHFTGDGNRWKELLPVNPGRAAPAPIGFKANVGERINLPASWPTGVPVPIPPSAAPAVPPKPASPVNTYLVKAGDTGQKVAAAFTGDQSRWKELLTVNPSLKSAQYGIALYAGHRINLPANWPATPGQAPVVTIGPVTIDTPARPALPAPAAAPQLPPAPMNAPAQSDARVAAQQLTDYLVSLGGLKARYKENAATVKGYQTRMGVSPADGKYGVGSAKTVMLNGLVPVTPLYWSSTGTAKQKADFTSLVKSYAAADPQRASQWNALLADVQKS